jgi:hypothetical protein
MRHTFLTREVVMHEYAGPLWVIDRDSRLIDLGELVVHDDDDGAPRRFSWRTGRVAAVILLCLVSLGASVRVPPGLGTPLWTGEVSLAGFALGSTFLAGAEPGSRVVVGRDLITGDPRWEAQVDDPPQINRSIGNFAAVITKEPSSPDQNDVRQNITVILSPTGAVLARTLGDQLFQTTVGGYFLLSMGQAIGCPDETGRCVDVAAFDAVTGAPVWRQVIPGVVLTRSGGETSRFLTGRGDGLITLRDVATGAAIETYQVPGALRLVMVVGDTLVTADRGPTGAVVSAYRPGPFRRLWSVTVPAGDTVSDSTAQFYLRDCGRLVCLHVDGGNAVLDPDTGVMRAYVGLEVVDEVGSILLAVPTFEQAGTSRERRVVHLLDAADGRELRVLPDTVQVPWAGSGGRALFARAAPGEVTGFVVLTPDGELHRLGGVPGADLSCQARDQILACVDPVGSVRVWRLPT